MFKFNLQECRDASIHLDAVGEDTAGGIVTKKWFDKWVVVRIPIARPACICM
jgi:hypothetical protein